MKKILLFFALLFSGSFLMAQTPCSDIFISEYVEGWYNNKALELYNPTSSPITLDNVYRLVRFSNGSTTSDQDPLYALPLVGTIEPYQVLVMIQDTTKPGQDTMVWPSLRKKATWLAPYDYNGTTPGGNCVFWNGDDAVSLQKLINSTWKDIDIFGEIGVRPLDWQGGTSGAWTATAPYWQGQGAYLTKDQTCIRKHTIKYGIDRIAMSHYGDSVTGIYPNSFNTFVEYDTMPVNFFDSLGSHWCDCKNIQAIKNVNHGSQVTIQPNPVKNGTFSVSASTTIQSIELLTMVGKSIYKEEFAYQLKEQKVQLTRLPSGLYLVRIVLSTNEEVIKKVIVE